MRREKPVRAAPRALEPDDQRQLLCACERSSARDRALVVLLLLTALRLAEAVAPDLDDMQVTARKGRVVVRSGSAIRFCAGARGYTRSAHRRPGGRPCTSPPVRLG